MQLKWIISRDKSKAILNNKFEVSIHEIDINKRTPSSQPITNKINSSLAFQKLDTGKVYECTIIKNDMQSYFDKMSIDDLSKFMPKLMSTLGDLYESK